MKIVSTIIAIVIGLCVLAGYFLQSFFPVLRAPLQYVLNWAIILAAGASLIGIINLLSMHWHKIATRKHGYGYSLVVLAGFLATLILGVTLRPAYIQWITQIQFAAEMTLMALLSVTLAFAGLRIFRRKLNLLLVTFVISALVYLLINISYLTASSSPAINNIVLAINRIPVAGARGILIGVALGSLTMSLRILLGAERPYGG